jgi:hypothetical protein
METVNAVSVMAFWGTAGALDREAFLSEHPNHVLVGLRIPQDDPRSVFGQGGGETAAITDGAPDDLPGPGPNSILLAIASRAGQAHSAKVTLGRAENNDIVAAVPRTGPR